jgi:acetyl-CoA carboxylase biotin carboxyl carrier protein
MPDPPAKSDPIAPDVRTIHHLVRLMQRYDLTAIDLGEGPNKIRLRRRAADPGASHPPAGAPGVAHGTAAPVQSAPNPAQSAPPATVSKGTVIESPMVGTFYSSSAPDAPPFVTVGSVVHQDTTVCVIEAMKVFTDIPAGVSGMITEIMVKNGQPVEFGQALFRVSQE